MARVHLSTVAYLFLLAGQAGGQDSVLTCYWLDSTTESQFKTADSSMSAFWADWSGRDSIVMVDTGTGGGSATVTIKAAGGMKGLYFAMVVSDDAWVVHDPPGYGASDRLDVFIDTLQRDEIWTCTDCLIGLYDSRLTYSTRSAGFYAMPADTAPSSLTYWVEDNAVWCLPCIVALPFIDAEECEGVGADAVVLDAGVKAFELRYPWRLFVHDGMGCDTGLKVGGYVPAAGSVWSFSAGYLDVDPVLDTVEQELLGWLGATPWSGDQNYWGDLAMGPGFPAAPVPADTLGSVNVRTGRSVPVRVQRASTSAVYSLDGRRRLDAIFHGPEVVVQAFGDGTRRTVLLQARRP